MNRNTKDIVHEAEIFATEAHKGQSRPNAAADAYIDHPKQVVEIVRSVDGTPEELAATWLHDVVEDTDVTLDQIRERFGNAVAEIVDGLTDPLDFADKPTKIRKKMQAERVINKSDSVKRIKVADQTANVYMMGFDPPTHWNTQKRRDYIEGARQIASNCAGIDNRLDELFTETYQKVDAILPKN